jgi:hypothetical protein
VAVDNLGSDMGKLAPMAEALAASYGCRPRQHLADGGFAKHDDIAALARAAIEAYVPVPQARDSSRDRHAARAEIRRGWAAWRERMASDAAKAIYKQHAAGPSALSLGRCRRAGKSTRAPGCGQMQGPKARWRC